MKLEELREELRKIDMLLDVKSEWDMTTIYCRSTNETILRNMKNSPIIEEMDKARMLVSVETLYKAVELMTIYVMAQRGYIVKKELFQFKFYCSFIKRNEVYSYLNYNSVNKEFFLDDKRIIENSQIESVFTQEDIKKFPQDIQDMIEIGVLVKEVYYGD